MTNDPQPRKAIERMADRVEPRNRHRQRALLFCLPDNLVDARPQLEVSVVQLVLRRQTGYRCRPARHFFHNRVRGAEVEAVGPVAMQARRIEFIIARNLTTGFPGRQPPVNLGALDMLTGTASSGHATHPYSSQITLHKSPRAPGRTPLNSVNAKAFWEVYFTPDLRLPYSPGAA